MGKVFSGCILASDVDDTLLDSGFCAPDNIEWIKRFSDDGGRFLLCTGRSVTALGPVKKALGYLPMSLVCNGGMLYDFQSEKTIFAACLANDDKYLIKQITEIFPQLAIEIHCGFEIYVLNPSSESSDHAVYEELDVKFAKFEDIKDKEWNKTIVFLNDENTERKPLEELIENFCLSESKVINTCCFINGIKRNYVEIHPKNVSKAEGLAKVREMFSVNKGDLFAIGDYYNDVEMLKYADISAAVKDSPSDVKCYADYIAVSCKDAAVADFIKYLYNLRKKGCK